MGVQLLSLDAVRLTAKTLPLSALAAGTLAALPGLIAVAAGGSDLTGAVVATTLVLGSLAGLAVDDPAATTLEPSPTTLLARRGRRLALLLGGIALAGAASAALVALAHDGPPISLLARLREGMAAAALAAAVSCGIARQTGERRPGSVGVFAGLLGTLLISALAFRVRGLPSVNAEVDAARWWWVTGAGWALALWWSRDPARR